MKTKFLVTAILLCSCLTGWGYPRSIAREQVSQIQIGQTTEADLLNLFGPPTTRFVDLAHVISLDWFRSIPMPPASYLPFIGELVGGRNVEAQQLSVVLGSGGRVIRYGMHSSKDKPRADGVCAIADQNRSSK